MLQQTGICAVEEWPAPVPEPGEVLVRIRSVTICASDIHMFAEGNVAMIIEFFGRGAVMALNPEKSKVSDKIAFTANPSVPGKGRDHASIHSGNGLALYSLSKNLKAAYKVMELAFSPRIMKQVATEMFLPYGWIVPRPSVLKDPAVTAKASHLKIAGEELLDASKNYFFFLPSLVTEISSMQSNA